MTVIDMAGYAGKHYLFCSIAHRMFLLFSLGAEKQHQKKDTKHSAFSTDHSTDTKHSAFSTNHLTDTKHSAFSTDHWTDIDKTKHNYNQQHRKLSNHATKPLTYTQTRATK